MLPAAEKVVLVLEGIGDDKIRINSSSLDLPSSCTRLRGSPRARRLTPFGPTKCRHLPHPPDQRCDGRNRLPRTHKMGL